jgi:membrane protease YdiL (CAAX protease family)
MYIEQAFKWKHDWWRYLVGVLIVFIIGWQLIGVIPIVFVSILKADSLSQFMEAGLTNFASLYPPKSNLYLLLMLFTFVGGFIGLIFTVILLHKQKIRQLTTSRKKVDWGRFFFSFGIIAILTVGLTLMDFYTNPDDYVVQFELIPFLVMAVISVIFIPIQTSFEELFFRGYMMQGIGVITKSKWIPLIITSVIFGGLHLFNPEVEKLGNIIMIYYIGTGLFLGIITLMDEGLELAMGFHAATNLVAALLVTADWTVLQTNSILLDISDPTAGVDVLIPIFIFYPILLGIMAWRYKWNNWYEKLFGRIVIPSEQIPIEEENGY